MQKAIITVVGMDQVGIISRVCSYLAERNINILDISQTIVQNYFNMMMVTDVTNISEKFAEVSDGLTKLGEEIGVIIKLQRSEIFEKMQRI